MYSFTPTAAGFAGRSFGTTALGAGGIAAGAVIAKLKEGTFTWHQLVNGFGEKAACPNACDVTEIEPEDHSWSAEDCGDNRYG